MGRESSTTEGVQVSPIRVAVLNDYELVVMGVGSMLGAFPDRVEVVEFDLVDEIPQRQVDVALFDTYGRTDRGEERIRKLVADPRVGAVVVYTHSLPPAEVSHLLELGVRGCLSKSLTAAELVGDIEGVALGEQRVSSFPDQLPDDVTPPNPGEEWGLSYRESEVLALLTEGLRNKDIAAALFIGTETVKSHLASIFDKMRVSSRSEAVAVALRAGAFAQPVRMMR
jgi:DNA-binding NarL/FixJ family response regulator